MANDRRRNLARRSRTISKRRLPSIQELPTAIEEADHAAAAGDHDEAIRIWKKLSQCDDRNYLWPLRMAESHWAIGRISQSMDAMTRATRLAMDDCSALLDIASTLTRCERFDEAIHTLQHVTEIAPNNSIGWQRKAEAELRVNRLDDALKSIQAAMVVDMNDAGSLLVYVRILRRRHQYLDACQVLSCLTSRDALPLLKKISIQYEFAATLDAANRFNEAFEALETAKSLQRPAPEHLAAASKRAIQTFEVLWKNLTANDYAAWIKQSFNCPCAGMAVLVGHPRSGTTLLEKHLARHPDVIDLDETKVLDTALGVAFGKLEQGKTPVDLLREATPSAIAAIRKTYFDSVARETRQSLAGKVVVDKHPEMLRYLPFVARAFPEAKVIMCIRDPRDVCLSCYMTELPINSVSVNFLTMESTANRFNEIMQGYLRMREQLACPLLEIKYEDFVSKVADNLSAIYDFLCLESRTIEHSSIPAGEYVRSPSYGAVAEPIGKHRIERWRNYESALSQVMPVLRQSITSLGYTL